MKFPTISAGRTRWSPELGNQDALIMVLPICALLLVLVAYPLLKLGYDSLTQGYGAANYIRVFERSSTRNAIVTTLSNSALVTVLAIGLGGVIAWHLRCIRNRHLQLLIWAGIFVPLWLGTVVKTFALVLVLGNTGLVNAMLELLGLPTVTILYTPVAVVYGIVYAMIPYAVFTLFAIFRGIDDNVIQAAQCMGASRSEALFGIVLPMALPGLIASTAIVFALTVGFYVTPLVLGGAQSPFVASLIAQDIFMYFDYPEAATLSVVLILCACLVLAAAIVGVGPERFRRTMSR